MSIDDEFIQTIIASPDDDTPRLVYADWLDEQADPRGEFIRIQIELAKMAHDDPRRWDLELRQGRLMRWYGWQWWFMPFDPSSVRPTFRRGFPEDFELSFSKLEAKFSTLFQVYPLFRFLTVYCNSQSQVPYMLGSCNLSRLVRLELRFECFSDDARVSLNTCWALVDSRQLQSLKHLGLLAESFDRTGERELQLAFGDRLHLRRYRN
jgi:uncharacterized protein (TIGR02996 family)